MLPPFLPKFSVCEFFSLFLIPLFGFVGGGEQSDCGAHTRPIITPTVALKCVSNLGLRERTWRKPTQAWGEHAKSTSKGPCWPIQLWTFLVWGSSANHRSAWQQAYWLISTLDQLLGDLNHSKALAFMSHASGFWDQICKVSRN